MSHKSISVARSHQTSMNKINQTKSEYADELQPVDLQLMLDWYIKKCQQIHRYLPQSLPKHSYTQPFKLIFNKVSGINAGKNAGNSLQYLRVSAQFITKDLDLMGKTQYYQCLEPIIDSKYQFPISFYYHSSIDRNCDSFKLYLIFEVLTIKDGVVETIVQIGKSVINKPLIECSSKTMSLYKQCSFIDLIEDNDRLTASPTSFVYEIISKLQLKVLSRLIPMNQTFSSQDQITGVLDSFLLNDPEQNVYQEQLCEIKIQTLQVYIPKKFEICLLQQLKNTKLFKGQIKIDKRKIVCGFHNQYQFVSPVERDLDYIQEDQSKEWNIYEAANQQSIIKVPYYIIEKQHEYKCTFGVAMLFQINEETFEVSILNLSPNLNGGVSEINQSMINGAGVGLVDNIIEVKSKQIPSIILQYQVEEIIQRPLDISDHKLRASNNRLTFKTQKNTITQQQIRLQSKMMEEVERERMRLEREKQELQMMKTNNYISYQEDFEKRFEMQREELWKKQKLLQEQYRGEVEKQIRRKLELEQEIREMKERLTAIEEKGSMLPSHRPSYNQTPPNMEDNSYIRYANNDSVATGAFNFSVQKVMPTYLLEQQKTIPIAEVRQIMASGFEKNQAIIHKQYQKYNLASKFTFQLTTVLWSSQLDPPKSFFILFKFFNFNQFRTDTITFIESEFEHHQLIKLHHYTYGYQDVTPVYHFLVDPSEYENPEILQQDLTDYLCRNNAILDIFDAETHVYIGQINIKLSDLIKGNKSQILVAKEFNIVRVKEQQNYGVMQILIKNQEVGCKHTVSLTHKKREKDIKKKIVSNNPIVISKQELSDERSSKTSTLINKQSTKNRQEKRIENYKKKIQASRNQGIVKFDGVSEQEKGYLINKIQQYKQKKMPQYINKIYENILNETIVLHPYTGQSKIFNYQFTNMSETPGSFRISIQAGEEKANDELNVVKSSFQWKHYVSKYGHIPPKLYECINDEDCFYLSPGESIPLLFKYLSFNDHLSENGKQKKFFNVSIIKEENNWIVGGFSLVIEPHQSIINHSYVLYQPGGHVIDIILPVLYSSSDSKIPKHLFITYDGAEAEWINQYEILLKLQTPEIMSRVKFNLLLYEDQYLNELKENWLMEVHAYEGVCTFSRAQEKTKFKISLPENISVTSINDKFRLYSSHPDLVFENEIIEGYRLQRSGPVEIWCELLANTRISQIQITCTDSQSNLIYGWIVKVFPYVPKRT